MRMVENRKLAWAVLVVCVLVSVFALGGGAVGRERSRVIKVFNEGADTSLTTRHSMDAYLDGAGEAAKLMANEAEMRLGASDLTASALKNADLVGKDEADLDDRYAAYTELKAQVEKIYNDMYNQLSDADFRDFKLAYDDFWGQDDLISHDSYHGLARAYNRLIAGFPGSVVAGLTRQGALNTFGG